MPDAPRRGRILQSRPRTQAHQSRKGRSRSVPALLVIVLTDLRINRSRPSESVWPVTRLRTGKPIIISAPCSRELKEIVQSLVERAEALRGGRIDPREDNPPDSLMIRGT